MKFRPFVGAAHALTLFLTAPLVACSSTTSTPACTSRAGTYAVSYTAQSGTCGAIATVIVTFDGDAGSLLAPGCHGTTTQSADQCTTTSQAITCPSGDASGDVVQISGDAHWVSDGSTASGSLELEILSRAGVVLCAGAYEVSYTRK